jgi:hypothetical protein
MDIELGCMITKVNYVNILSGNNDRRIGYIQSKNLQDISDWRKGRPGNILTQWAKAIGTYEITEANHKIVISKIKQKYQDKINFILNLPFVIETNEFICVHSGLESRKDWWETSQWSAWTSDINSVNKTGKTGLINNSCEGYTYIRNSKGELGWIPKDSFRMIETLNNLLVKQMSIFNF